MVSEIIDSEAASSHNRDTYDLLIAAAQKQQTVYQEGVPVQVDRLDSESLYWQTRLVNYPKFAALATNIKALVGMADQADMYLDPACAAGARRQIVDFCGWLMTGIDAKASETVLDGKNRQAALVDKTLNTKSEKVITLNEKAKEGLGAAFFGQPQQNK